jgi:hypothetical protein
MKLVAISCTAAVLAGACATAGPDRQLAEERCSISFRPYVHESAYGGLRSYGARVATSGSERYCRQIQEENQRYAERALTQLRTNAVYPELPSAVSD